MRRSHSAPIHGRARTLWCSLAVGGAAISALLALTVMLAGSTSHRAASVGLMVIDTPEPSLNPPIDERNLTEPAQVDSQARRAHDDDEAHGTPASANDQALHTAPRQTTGTTAEQPQQEYVTFDGRRLKPVKQMSMNVTAYSPDARSCGEWADGVTASGYSVWTNGMKLVAADTNLLPFGTIITVPGYNDGKPVQVLDRGGAIKGHRLDLLYPSHESALQWGRKDLQITVWQYAD